MRNSPGTLYKLVLLKPMTKRILSGCQWSGTVVCSLPADTTTARGRFVPSSLGIGPDVVWTARPQTIRNHGESMVIGGCLGQYMRTPSERIRAALDRADVNRAVRLCTIVTDRPSIVVDEERLAALLEASPGKPYSTALAQNGQALKAVAVAASSQVK